MISKRPRNAKRSAKMATNRRVGKKATMAHAVRSGKKIALPDAAKMTVAKRVAKRRAALRALGLRPVQIWVPDTRAPGFAEECRRQSRLLRNDPHEKVVLDWIEQVADTTDWT